MSRPKRYAEAAKHAPTHVSVADVEVLEHRVVELRTKGNSFREINRILGVTRADRIFNRAIAREGNIELSRQHAIALEAERLDALQAGIWSKAVDGDPEAIRACLGVLTRRAKMLGLDHADAMSARAVEVEETRVRLLADALVGALEAAGLDRETQARVLDAFDQAKPVTIEGELGPESDLL